MSHKEDPPKRSFNQKLVRRLSFSPKVSKNLVDKNAATEADKPEERKSSLSRRPAPKSGSRRMITRSAQTPAESMKTNESTDSTPPTAVKPPRHPSPKTISTNERPPSQPSAPLSPIKARPSNAPVGLPNPARGDPKFMWKPMQGFATG